MAINNHPAKGSILLCDFNQGFSEPEMVKRRPVIVLSPKISCRPKLCTVVALSTTEPSPRMAYHSQIDLKVQLPHKYASKDLWIKGDMIYAVGFHRLDFISYGKDNQGKRQYYLHTLNESQMKTVKACVLHGLALPDNYRQE